MFLVLSGVCASICLWEIVRYYKFKSDKKEIGRKERSALRKSVEKSYGEISEENVKKHSQELEPRIQQYQVSVDSYIKRAKQLNWTIVKILILEFFSALFGIVIGLVVTYNDIITSNYLLIDFQKAILLFSIGLGAGS